MSSLCAVFLFTLLSASCLTPAHVLEVCHSPDSFKSRWNLSVSNLTQDLDQFRVSCKKLLESFPLDEVDGNFVRTVKNCVFSRSSPTPLRGPLRLAAVSKDVIEGVLELDLTLTQSEDFLSYVSGRRLLPGSVPLAHRYGGHQFGFWAGQLGDGRAHSLGQFTNRRGEVWELQLKGSGKTPYSRSGDGRAVIRSSVREFLCSEAMFALGVPTSRAASLVVSEEPVFRDQFYDGNVKTERGAVVLRLAKSWFRIGSLEVLSRSGELDLLRKLLHFVINEHFTEIRSEDPDRYLVFFSTVVNQTAQLIAHWTSLGFAHGVCNTDNFSLLSITLDYGPFGFMDSYDPGFVPNWSDDEGRYRIGAQADVGLFNLEKLLEALSPVLSTQQHREATAALTGYAAVYQTRTHQLFRDKLGLLGNDDDDEDDGFLIAFLLKMMEDSRSDFSMVFRELSEASEDQLHSRNFTQMWALEDLASHELFSDWLSSYLLRLHRQKNHSDLDRQSRMQSVNPRYVLRTWMAESAVRTAERNDFSEVELLLRVLSSPFVKQRAAEEAGYAQRPPEWPRG